MNEDKEQDISVHKKYNKLKNNILAKQDLIHRNEDNANFEDGQDTTNSNPWIIKNLEEFLYYCCPECDNKNQSKNNFINHVLSFHPMAKQYLETIESLKIEDSSDCIDEENVENECDIDDFVKSENNEQPVKTYTCNFCNKYFTTFKEHWDWHNSGTKSVVKTEPYFENEDQSNDQYDDSIGQEDSYEIYHQEKEVRRKVSTYIVILLWFKILFLMVICNI